MVTGVLPWLHIVTCRVSWLQPCHVIMVTVCHDSTCCQLSWVHPPSPPRQLTLVIVSDVDALVGITLQLRSVEEALDLSFRDGVRETARSDDELLVHTNLHIVHVIHDRGYHV